MSEVDTFVEHINLNKGKVTYAQLRWATAKDVDVDNGVMTAAGIVDDIDYINVNLGIGDVRLTPVKGSLCLIGVVEGNDAETYLLHADQVDEIIFNGGENGGITINSKLCEQLDKLTARVDGIIDALTSSAVIAQDGGAAYKANITSKLSKLTDKEDFKDISNEKIKH